jgi:hypothetical protein
LTDAGQAVLPPLREGRPTRRGPRVLPPRDRA